MENELKIGEYNRLRIIKEVPFGLYLDGYEDEILLPLQYVPETYEIDGYIDVFIYRDSEDRIIATTLKPLATINQFAFLEVKQVSPIGVFLEWGLMKDLLVPFSQQLEKMSVGKSYLVYVYLDPQTDRIVASARIDKFLPNPKDIEEFTIGQKVQALPFEYTNLGIKCLVNNCKIGQLFKNEIFTNVKLGEVIDVYIYNIREDDKLDLRLEAIGLERIDSQKDKLLSLLDEQNGILYLHDKSPAEEIYEQLGMSKKDFKKAVGGLYKSKRIKLGEGCIIKL
ncbi:CvfB family protein [Aquirufa rosea]|uniref:GntR family transcriptional regulator n=1 Tax=Aquirufa rosea TaxID=2509241 RepID=A0A4Q1C2L5_9BACT|nr:S1-like domain-containing RNA-binding protein [Aquirufa rosea]RXK52428.1 GntR family transcriptional regulator [Aquirufa rosea]